MEARLFILRCPECGAWADEQDGARICWDCNAHPEGDYPDLEHVEYLPADSVAGLVEAAKATKRFLENIDPLIDCDYSDTGERPTDAEREARAVYRSTTQALASLPTQPEPEQGGS